MEAASLALSMIDVVQGWRYAFVDSSASLRSSEGGLLEQYDLYMAILEESLSSMHMLKELNASEALERAMKRCHDIGCYLASRQEKLRGEGMKKRTAFVFAPWQLLKEKQNDFRDSVNVVHSLVQRFVEHLAYSERSVC